MDGHIYGYNLPISEKTKMVPWEEKVRIVEEVKSDFRFKEYIFGCLNCGVCTASCPSNRFFDYSPGRSSRGSWRKMWRSSMI
jgi:heterodisulfide reductase subunit C